MHLYPLEFIPIYKTKIWGGNQLNNIKNIDPAIDQIGESWEISAVQDNVSVVAHGTYKGLTLNELITLYPSQLLGSKVTQQFGTQFPLLIKFINAAQDLSIQVHPDDQTALANHNCLGKTEMWYIMDADHNARLTLGFKQDCNKYAFAKAISQQNVEQLLNNVPTQTGDAYFIKPGLIHAIGAGVTLAEIQQSSDITYRVYDYDRRDQQGKPRALHIDQSIAVADYKQSKDHVIDYNPTQSGTQQLVSNNYFTTDYHNFTGCKRLAIDIHNSFMVIMNVGAPCIIIYDSGAITIDYGQSVLIPAAIPNVLIKCVDDAKLLSVHL